MSEPKLHTVILSDLHLSDAELGRPGRSLWKRYKRPKFFIDQSFRRLLHFLQSQIQSDEKIELVLNGDIFDFDSVMRLPLHTRFHISWLERKRGLNPEEDKSRFKMEVILGDHPIWVMALREWVQNGHSIVFIIGNHDIELHWPLVQKELLKTIAASEEQEKQIRVCEWFYLSGGDTAIEHGNQYDDYCVVTSPIHPFIKKGKRIQVRIPFGNITGRYMTNGMGLFNPHVESSFLMTLPEYIKFFYKYALRVQPFLLFTWLWSAAVSFWVSLTDGLLPPMRDPLYIEQRVEGIAQKSNSTSTTVRTLMALHVHPAIYNPIKIARELWLDRFFLLAFIGFMSFELYALIDLIIPISWIWFLLFFVLLIPILIFYARNIKSEVIPSQEVALKQSPLIAQITHTKRVVFGHTHREMHTFVDQTEVLNTGTWSPAFKDPECRESYGKKCFAWIKPVAPSEEGAEGASNRTSEVYIWKDSGLEALPVKK